MWAALESAHVQKRPGTRFNAYDDFFSIRKEENESLQALIARIGGAMTKMQNLRLKHFDLDKLDEELVCMAMIHALPETYAGFTSSILLLGSLSKTALPDAFQVEETNRRRRAVHTTTNNDVTLLAPAVNHTKNTRTCGCKPSVPCDLCKKTGHCLHNCYTCA